MRVPKITPKKKKSGSILLRFRLTQEGTQRTYELSLPLKWSLHRDRQKAEQIAQLIRDDIKHDLLGLQPTTFDPTLQKYRPGLPSAPKKTKNLLDVWSEFVKFKIGEALVSRHWEFHRQNF